MRPIIGLTHSIHQDEETMHLPTSYTNAILAAGGTPLVLPATKNPAVIEQYLSLVDGMLFIGGDDVNPAAYGESVLWQCGDICPLRDEYELALCRAAVARKLPILAICRGIQLVNVALGGSLYQDIRSQKPNAIAHGQKMLSRYAAHPVLVREGSILEHIFGSREVMVNTFHHQAIKQPGKGLSVTAQAPDGVIEAVELEDYPFFVGVQWHPERMQEHANLFQALVAACRR